MIQIWPMTAILNDSGVANLMFLLVWPIDDSGEPPYTADETASYTERRKPGRYAVTLNKIEYL